MKLEHQDFSQLSTKTTRKILSEGKKKRHTVQTISSRHKQIFPYLSRNKRSVGAFPQASFIADVITKITSAT